MPKLQARIVPHLWFDRAAVEAARFYVAVLPDSRMVSTTTLHDTPSGTVDVVRFELLGQEFMAISAGPPFTFNESVSFVVKCDTQAEIDAYREQLTANGGREVECGWLKDRYGLSWQIVPTVMDEMLCTQDPAALARVTQAFLGMKRFDIAALQRAFAGEQAENGQ